MIFDGVLWYDELEFSLSYDLKELNYDIWVFVELCLLLKGIRFFFDCSGFFE